MSVWHENLVAYGRGYAMGRLLGRIDLNTTLSLAKQEEALALLRDLQQCRPPQSKLALAKEFGRTAAKVIIPQLAPLVWAWVLALASATGAVAWAGWRVLRGSMGF